MLHIHYKWAFKPSVAITHIDHAMIKNKKIKKTSISCILPKSACTVLHHKLKIYNELLPQPTFRQNTSDEKNASSPTWPSLQLSHQNHRGHLHHQEQQPSPTKKNLIHNGIF